MQGRAQPHVHGEKALAREAKELYFRLNPKHEEKRLSGKVLRMRDARNTFTFPRVG